MNVVKLLLKFINRRNKINKPIVYIDMDNILVDFKSGVDKLSVWEQNQYHGRYDECPGIFAKMNPVQGALTSFSVLNRHFDCYIISSAPWDNPDAWKDKRTWVERYLGKDSRERLIITHHKNLNIGHYLIDRKVPNDERDFIGEFIQFGSEQFSDWDIVVNYLLKKHNIK